MDPLYVVGNFPPPLNGQTLATQRLVELLSDTYAVHRVNTSFTRDDDVQANVRFSPAKVRHYLRLRRHIRQALAEAPAAPVLWAAISPAPLGHLRDVLTVRPAFQPGQPVYAVIHWGDFDRVFRQALTATTAKRLVRRLTGFVFLNDHLAGRCARWIPDAKRFVIPNTIDATVRCTDDEVTTKQARHPQRNYLRLLYLSNMILSKGYLDVLHAVRLLHRRGLPLHTAFAGGWTSDADRRAFEQLVTAEGLHEIVTHHGRIADRARIKALHLEADVFLLPTYYPTEAQPVALLEALNAGTPVVATRHAGIPDIVREDTDAVLVPPQAPDAIADAVERLADRPTWHGFSKHARQRFLNRFSPAAVRRQWEDLIRVDG